jgi:hypothetical protein
LRREEAGDADSCRRELDEAVSSAPMTGETLSHVRILEKLGEGGMGVVYKAEDTRLRRIVAFQCLRERAQHSDELRARFRREAQSIFSRFPLAVPTQERVRLDIHQRVAPSEPLTQGRHHPAGGSVGPSRPDLPV